MTRGRRLCTQFDWTIARSGGFSAGLAGRKGPDLKSRTDRGDARHSVKQMRRILKPKEQKRHGVVASGVVVPPIIH
jgi:hypothetical protein